MITLDFHILKQGFIDLGRDWLDINPQEVKVGGVIGVVLARVEGSNPRGWISLPLPTPTHLSQPTGGHQICVWQSPCFCKLEKSVCLLGKANGGAAFRKEQCVTLFFFLLWCQLLAEPLAAGLGERFEIYMANMLHGRLHLWTRCFCPATDPYVDSTS